MLEEATAEAPLVSIVIPCYNGAAFLAAAIESCLAQTYRPIEVIVVDDASPDACADIARRYERQDPRVRLVRHPVNGGVSRAFNTGFGAARGQYLTRLAQDDVFHPDAVEVLCRELREHPEAGLVYGDYETIDEAGRPTGVCRLPGPDEALAWRNSIGLCVLWTRAAWERVGPFDPVADTAEDFDYWLRVAGLFPVVKCVGHAPLDVRTHPNMGSVRSAGRQEAAAAAVLRKAFWGPGPLRRRLLLRQKGLSYVTYSAASDYTENGRNLAALGRMVLSFWHWPLPYRRRDVKTALARPKLFLMILARLLRPRPPAGRGPAERGVEVIPALAPEGK